MCAVSFERTISKNEDLVCLTDAGDSLGDEEPGIVSFQIADESNYKSFNLSYSGSLVTLSMGNGNGQINRVFGVN